MILTRNIFFILLSFDALYLASNKEYKIETIRGFELLNQNDNKASVNSNDFHSINESSFQVHNWTKFGNFNMNS